MNRRGDDARQADGHRAREDRDRQVLLLVDLLPQLAGSQHVEDDESDDEEDHAEKGIEQAVQQHG
jgi:hypothetical protein